MKKLFLISFGVLVALIGFIAILYFLPCKDGACCGEKEGHCVAEGKHDGCKGEGHGCESKESCERKGDQCGDGHGKMHKEVRIEMHGDGGCAHGEMDKACGGHGEMDAACGGHGKMEGGKCMMPEMGMSCGPMMGCCCCMMMHGGMMHKEMCKMDSVVKKDSIVIIKK